MTDGYIHLGVLLTGGKAIGHVEIPEGVKEIGGEAFEARDGLISVVIPEGVTTIYRRAFLNCCNLVSVTLPESLEKIDHEAFAGCCKLEKMNFPAGLTVIGYDAFRGCEKLVNPPEATEEDPYVDTRMAYLEFIRNAPGVEDPDDLMHKDPAAFLKNAFISLGISPKMLEKEDR